MRGRHWTLEFYILKEGGREALVGSQIRSVCSEALCLIAVLCSAAKMFGSTPGGRSLGCLGQRGCVSRCCGLVLGTEAWASGADTCMGPGGGLWQ